MSKTLNVISENKDDLGWDVIRSKGAVDPQPQPAAVDYFANKRVLTEDTVTVQELEGDKWGTLGEDSNLIAFLSNENFFPPATWGGWIQEGPVDDYNAWGIPQCFMLSVVLKNGEVYTSSARRGIPTVDTRFSTTPATMVPIVIPAFQILNSGPENTKEINIFVPYQVSFTQGSNNSAFVVHFQVTEIDTEEESLFSFSAVDIGIMDQSEEGTPSTFDFNQLDKVVLWTEQYNTIYDVPYQAHEK